MNISKQIQRLRELDAKRTQGEWTWRNPNPTSYGDAHVDCESALAIAVCGDISKKIPHGYCGRAEPEEVEANAEYIAAMPEAISIINALEEKLKVAREGLDVGADDLENPRPI